jgi:hypothetical protein
MPEILDLAKTLCHKCSNGLFDLPGFDPAVARQCPFHGDFFIQRLNGHEPRLLFRPFGVPVWEAKEPAPHKNKGGFVNQPASVIKCDQTNEIFSSYRRAAETLGISKASITRFFQGLKPTAGKYTFTKMEGYE